MDNKFKQQLEKVRQDILAQIEILEKPPEFGPETYDDESHESQEFANQLSIAQDLRKRLVEIDSSLLKIQEGKYGVCEKCGKEISMELLEVAPESRLCKECKRLSANFETAR